MTIARSLASTVLTGFALAFAATPFSADRVSAAEMQQAEDGGIFFMPSGDFVAKGGPRRGEDSVRRSPTPNAELVSLKRRSGRSVQIESPADPAESAAGQARRAVVRNCPTNVATGFAPSDIHGAASPTNLVVVTNVDIGIYNKSNCAIVSRVPLRTFFNNFAIPSTETLFDPRVLYDRLSGRCLVVVESRNSGNTDQFLYVAGSTSNTCTSWRRIRFVLSRVSPAGLFCKAAATDFYDYPNAGYNIRRLVVTSNNFPASGGAYGTVMSINKLALYGTGRVTARCFRTSIPANTAPAVVGDSNSFMFLLSPGSGSGNLLRRLRLSTSTSGTTGDTLAFLSNINIFAWTAPPDAAQPNGQRLDTLDGRFQSASKQIGSFLWNVHAVNISSQSRVRLYKVSTSGTGVLFSRTFATTACTGTQHTFNPSVDTNSASTSAPAFVTLSRTCPASGAIGRAAHLIHRGPNSANPWVFNTVGISAAEWVTSSGSTTCNNNPGRFSCRWGDYSSTQIDPSNTAQAWGFNQLVTNTPFGTSQASWITRGGLVN